MEREWERLNEEERQGIFRDYDLLDGQGELNDNIFLAQWKRERGGSSALLAVKAGG